MNVLQFIITLKLKLVFYLYLQVTPEKSTKKTWSQRLKIISGSNSGSNSKRNHKSEASSNKQETLEMVHHHMPSALSRSMKYAETWMYGTVRGIPAPRIDSRGAYIFSPIQTEVAVMVCSCPEYLNGTTKKEVKKASVCKKCKGSRLPLAPIGGTVRVTRSSTAIMASHVAMQKNIATVRLPSSNSKSRPSIFNMQNDPYDLMRRSRLISPELQAIKGKDSMKNKVKSISPSKNRIVRKRSPSPNENSINKSNRSRSGTRNANKVRNNNRECWINLDDDTNSHPNARRSILNCDVNPYELVSNGDENSPIDDLYDAELLMHSKRYEDVLEPLYKKEQNKTKIVNNVAAIAGQRIRLCSDNIVQEIQEDDSHTVYEPVEFVDEKIVKEVQEIGLEYDVPQEITKIARSISPKRPPRRKHEVSIHEIESTPTLQLSTYVPQEVPSPSPNSIKSILKRTSQFLDLITINEDNSNKTNEQLSQNDTLPEIDSDGHYQDLSDTETTTIQTVQQQTITTTTTTTTTLHPTNLMNSTTRKRVQFLMENEIIKDYDYENENDHDNNEDELQSDKNTLQTNNIQNNDYCNKEEEKGDNNHLSTISLTCNVNTGGKNNTDDTVADKNKNDNKKMKIINNKNKNHNHNSVVIVQVKENNKKDLERSKDVLINTTKAVNATGHHHNNKNNNNKNDDKSNQVALDGKLVFIIFFLVLCSRLILLVH